MHFEIQIEMPTNYFKNVIIEKSMRNLKKQNHTLFLERLGKEQIKVKIGVAISVRSKELTHLQLANSISLTIWHPYLATKRQQNMLKI